MLNTDATNKPKPYVVVTFFVVASLLFYFGLALWFVPTGYISTIFELLLPLIFILPALLIGCRLAWILRSERRSLWLTLPICLGGVSLGALLIFFARFHAYFL